MTHEVLATAATRLLGREVAAAFVGRVIDGDPFIYEACRREDDEAVGVVLGLATGRLAA